MSDRRLRVGLDLDGSLESMSNSMSDLSQALAERDDLLLTCFRTESAVTSQRETRLRARVFWAPWWRHSRGRPIDDLLGRLDVIHVAGPSTPPTRHTPLLISVDDLRPLREGGTKSRVRQLRRAVARGATLVVSSRAARHEAMEALGLERAEIVVVRPPVGRVERTVDGRALVVSVTGNTHQFEGMSKELAAFAQRHGAPFVVVASNAVIQRLRATGVAADFVERRRGAEALSQARCVAHISDGARFPSFAVAALGAGVPTVSLATAINRELLGGAAALVPDEDDLVATLEELWSNEARRAIMRAAGLARAEDFSPWNVASAYANLYADVAMRSRV